jgi:hypothetical protein
VAARLRNGAVAGIVGGFVSAVWGLVMSPLLGTEILHETKLAAVPLLGKAALEPERAPLALLVGGASHFGVSIAWGIVFALMAYPASPLAMVAFGALFGVAVWRTMYDLVLPLFDAAWIVAGFSIARAATEHVVFGVGTALGLVWIRRRMRSGTASPSRDS